MRRLVSQARSAWAARDRTWGEPHSANGASSFHLVWEIPPAPLREVEATLEVLVPPEVSRLYFWALQVSFVADRKMQGSAHLGLQWHPRFPGSTAVNWGGYGAGRNGSALLRGSPSRLPSARNDRNTRDFDWQSGRRYRLRVARSSERPADGTRAWRGSVTDLETGVETVVRDLYSAGDAIVSPMVWSEVFARCEQPPVTVRWSDLAAVGEGGAVRPDRVRVNYQSRADGGCDNTTVSVDELGILQTTATRRQVPQGALLPVPGA